jgi:hypothetical protein
VKRTSFFSGFLFSRGAASALVMALPLAFLAACSASKNHATSGPGGAAGSAGAGAGGGMGGGMGGEAGAGGLGGGGTGGKPVPVDPKTCEEAADAKSYVGCDFWPTVTDNIVWPLFDYAVVVANNGESSADIVVSKDGQSVAKATVAPSSLATLYLPWVKELKSTDAFLACAPTAFKSQTVRAPGGAYHLTSTVPVTVYQFNAIEYAAKGGPPNKDWSQCTGIICQMNGCFSFTNDASLLLPSTAMTGNYRVTGMPTWVVPMMDPPNNFYPPYIAITGLKDNTQVNIKLSASASVAGGGGIASAQGGSAISFPINQGEVVELVTQSGGDLSGSLVTATAPVQVITGISCSYVPGDVPACDHLEESVFPAETLGKHYFVTVPTSHHGKPVAHVVRIYGNIDGTHLTYPGKNPGGPTNVNAGDVIDLGLVKDDFEIVGDQPFAVASFSVGASMIDPNLPTNQQKGDPDQSLMVSTEQYRTKYVFLAPGDYDISFIDVVQPMTAKLTLDGAAVNVAPTELSSGYGVARIQLGPGKDGAHVLTATEAVGLQVMGYGTYTSYQYPGGLNLSTIAIVPPK